jgi:DNA-binding LacI/PurR family transcriptional regulator
VVGRAFSSPSSGAILPVRRFTSYTPFYASWLNRIEAQFRALRYFTLAGTDHPDDATEARLIRRYIAWRNRNTDNPRLRALISTVNVA